MSYEKERGPFYGHEPQPKAIISIMGSEPSMMRHGETRTIEFKPQRPFRPHRIILAAPAFFDVLDVLVNGESQLEDGPVRGSIFTTLSFFELPEVMPMGNLTVTLRRNARVRQSWLVRKVRVWLGFEADPPDVCSVSVAGEVIQ
jgi:hypothetical protein